VYSLWITAQYFIFILLNPLFSIVDVCEKNIPICYTTLMNIIIYTKTGCPWCIGALTYLREVGVTFEERNVSENPAFLDEMIEKSEQSKAPTLDIDGEIFGDVGKDEIEVILREKGIIQ